MATSPYQTTYNDGRPTRRSLGEVPTAGYGSLPPEQWNKDGLRLICIMTRLFDTLRDEPFSDKFSRHEAAFLRHAAVVISRKQNNEGIYAVCCQMVKTLE
jgi:hypothetical protein